MAEKRLDLVIFGATGFTGKHAVKEVNRIAKEKSLSWGIAGRRKEALEAVLKEYASDSENIPIILADLKDEDGIKKMVEQAKVIINCCGPYRFYGEPIVKACIAAGTHHVDVSGEPQYMERMQLEYNKAAQEAGVYVISACGFDSIPCDLGIIFTQQKFNGEINSIESYLKGWSTSKITGPQLHYGTWESAIYGLAHADELRELRSKLYPERLPNFEPKLKTKGIIHRSSISDGWSAVFPGSDRSVALRSQRFLYENYKQRPIQIQTYITFKSLLSVLQVAFMGMIFSLLTKCSCGRKLLLKYPSFFSGGFVSHEGPSKETMENLHFSITFKAIGWTENLAEPTDKHADPPNKEMITKVTGKDPGYGATCTCLVYSAITILKEADKMPNNGGVFPPGAAFSKTSLIEELNKNGLKFEVISSIEK
ncbi:saccharopine dehydrogenase-like oxidoreductase [Orussus abietinus]|uniref:saccharopine dehydrogenase-like oxidoreductase n=1 Tax=Orussus abietinus TaxID=222816 RepID=UPI000625453C|nr:saccharopine dehydrogenase-like oxidoreductase [Orussus abietinus]XP_012280777.1 saccharopine dehydrogenase-like oxidoreductase [Orussus abietinus]XP_012280778.1 saccharopine dehydrogenase-like oxidoreductase [Orussus abietinus]